MFYFAGSSIFSKKGRGISRIGAHVERTLSFDNEAKISTKFMVCSP